MDKFRGQRIAPVGRDQDDHRRAEEDGPDPNGSLNGFGERGPEARYTPTGRLRENPSWCRAGAGAGKQVVDSWDNNDNGLPSSVNDPYGDLCRTAV